MRIRTILKKIYHILFSENRVQNKFNTLPYSNSLIDTLVPDFVEIGKNFVSAPGSVILGHDASLLLFYKQYRIEKTIIGDNVFLGANSVVLPGVIIGNNVIVGAGAIVTKNLDDNGVYAGNPARYMCSIEEYYNKCKTRNVLYDITPEMEQFYSNSARFNENILESFRQSLKVKP